MQLNWFNCKAHLPAAELSGANSFCNPKHKNNNGIWKQLNVKKLHWFIFLKKSVFYLAACVMTHNKTCFKSIKKYRYFLRGVSRRDELSWVAASHLPDCKLLSYTFCSSENKNLSLAALAFFFFNVKIFETLQYSALDSVVLEISSKQVLIASQVILAWISSWHFRLRGKASLCCSIVRNAKKFFLPWVDEAALPFA